MSYLSQLLLASNGIGFFSHFYGIYTGQHLNKLRVNAWSDRTLASVLGVLGTTNILALSPFSLLESTQGIFRLNFFVNAAILSVTWFNNADLASTFGSFSLYSNIFFVLANFFGGFIYTWRDGEEENDQF
eukprot:TRINITY_DN13175_c0_g1_i1.p1 TRINITY_DN13175_c0_g1~~TRINITY_DN13175_c0_g1_i1.p1  ORF type:complete len:145 (-),score=19.04 TRINITY_DN13175_c0_g1_i1:82-471(-)